MVAFCMLKLIAITQTSCLLLPGFRKIYNLNSYKNNLLPFQIDVFYKLNLVKTFLKQGIRKHPKRLNLKIVQKKALLANSNYVLQFIPNFSKQKTMSQNNVIKAQNNLIQIILVFILFGASNQNFIKFN